MLAEAKAKKEKEKKNVANTEQSKKKELSETLETKLEGYEYSYLNGLK